jgi:hypothetical protein
VVIKEKLVSPEVDPALRNCAPDPGKPILRDDADESEFIAKLKNRGDDCESKLNATWKTLDDSRARADAFNAGTGNPR